MELIEKMDPKLLQPNSWNTNVVTPENEEKLEKSMKRLGVFKPITVRTLEDGTLEILGGEHRVDLAIRSGMTEIPVINLGRIGDKEAKEMGLVDNARYGSDDSLQLAGLMEELGDDAEEIASFLPYSDMDITEIFSSKSIDLSDLEMSDDDDLPASEDSSVSILTHQIMRFKIPIEDADAITEIIEQIMKAQKFDSSDSMTNAGDALVYLARNGIGGSK